MKLDQRTVVIAQIAAATAANAMTALRAAITEAQSQGIPKEEIREVLALAQEVQQAPIAHTDSLAKQLLRESPSKPKSEHKRHHHHEHGEDCGCHS